MVSSADSESLKPVDKVTPITSLLRSLNLNRGRLPHSLTFRDGVGPDKSVCQIVSRISNCVDVRSKKTNERELTNCTKYDCKINCEEPYNLNSGAELATPNLQSCATNPYSRFFKRGDTDDVSLLNYSNYLQWSSTKCSASFGEEVLPLFCASIDTNRCEDSDIKLQIKEDENDHLTNSNLDNQLVPTEDSIASARKKSVDIKMPDYQQVLTNIDDENSSPKLLRNDLRAEIPAGDGHSIRSLNTKIVKPNKNVKPQVVPCSNKPKIHDLVNRLDGNKSRKPIVIPHSPRHTSEGCASIQESLASDLQQARSNRTKKVRSNALANSSSSRKKFDRSSEDCAKLSSGRQSERTEDHGATAHSNEKNKTFTKRHSNSLKILREIISYEDHNLKCRYSKVSEGSWDTSKDSNRRLKAINLSNEHFSPGIDKDVESHSLPAVHQLGQVDKLSHTGPSTEPSSILSPTRPPSSTFMDEQVQCCLPTFVSSNDKLLKSYNAVASQTLNPSFHQIQPKMSSISTETIKIQYQCKQVNTEKRQLIDIATGSDTPQVSSEVMSDVMPTETPITQDPVQSKLDGFIEPEVSMLDSQPNTEMSDMSQQKEAELIAGDNCRNASECESTLHDEEHETIQATLEDLLSQVNASLSNNKKLEMTNEKLCVVPRALIGYILSLIYLSIFSWVFWSLRMSMSYQ